MKLVSLAFIALAACSGSGKGTSGGATADSAAIPSTDTAKSKSSSTLAVSSTRRHQIVFAGTSLTAGLGLNPDSAYPMLIQRKIDSAGLPFEVTNAGVSGETSSGLLDRLDWLLRGKFDVIVVETGANDMLRGVPVTSLHANLDTIVGRIQRARPTARIALVQMEALPNMGRQYDVDLHDTYLEVARAHHVILLPFLLDHVAGIPRLNQSDGMHPNDVGEHIVADNMWKGLEPILKTVAANH